MTNEDSKDQDSDQEKTETQLGFDADSFGESERDLEPVFEDFEDEEEFESAYEETAEDSFEDSFENSRYSSDYEEDTLDYDVDPESLMAEEEEFEASAAAKIAAAWQAEQLKPELAQESEPEPELEPEPEPQAPPEPEVNEKWPDETSNTWPIGLIAVAVVALLLLTAGGYGVMQQRATMQQEIRTLQAAAATSVSPREVAASRENQRALQARNVELQNTIDALHTEIRSLRDTTRGLEAQLAEVQADQNTPAAKEPEPRVTTAKKAAPVSTAVASSDQTGDWFVNFSSYGTSEAANAWVEKLKPESGQVVVAPTVKNGRTYYRVRVIGLGSQVEADAVAEVLAQRYKLPKLWVGQQ